MAKIRDIVKISEICMAKIRDCAKKGQNKVTHHTHTRMRKKKGTISHLFWDVSRTSSLCSSICCSPGY